MLCASAVDAMLKEKGYEEGTLNQRIDKAVEDHLLTKEMGTWGDLETIWMLGFTGQRFKQAAGPRGGGGLFTILNPFALWPPRQSGGGRPVGPCDHNGKREPP
jgi:hypothetical protein